VIFFAWQRKTISLIFSALIFAIEMFLIYDYIRMFLDTANHEWLFVDFDVITFAIRIYTVINVCYIVFWFLRYTYWRFRKDKA